MPQQFIFSLDRKTYKDFQNLPQVFIDNFYSNQDYLLIHGNDRRRYVCQFRRGRANDLQFYDNEWKAFVKSNIQPSVRILHFVREAHDTFYVTGYDNNGIEGPGYGIDVIQDRVFKCFVECRASVQHLPDEFIKNLWGNRIWVSINGLRFKLNYERLQPYPQYEEIINCLSGDRWDQLVEFAGIVVGQRMVFTNLGDNTLNLMVFDDSGLGLFDERVYPTMLRLPTRQIPYYAAADKRANHACTWPGHRGHVNEDDVFYTELNAAICDYRRLTIHAKLCEDRMMHTYSRAMLCHNDVYYPMKVKMSFHPEDPMRTNHVTLNGNWRQFGAKCGFVMPMILRFKFSEIIQEVKSGVHHQVVIFEVC